ncbi:9059_t:CDS:2, partial [Racocetra fulgida]
PNQYPVPDNYMVETTYGKKEIMITCFINYYNEKPRYKIQFGLNENEYVYSDHSPTDAANAYLKAYYEKIAFEERAKNPNSLTSLEDHIKQYFSAKDNVTIDELVFTINNSRFRIIYQPKANDEAKPIFERLSQINAIMDKKIPIYLIKLQQFKDKLNSDHEIHITDSEIINEVESSLGNGTRRSIKDILRFLIPSMVSKGILNYSEPTLHIRISGDGRNVGHKIKHVMSYDTLCIALAPLIEELHDIKTGFIDNNGYKWNIELYISADWKFLGICLGHKSANSANFCLWCSINKSQNGILELNNERQDNWTIDKNIDDINQNYQNILRHKNSPLFSMIPICNWVVDELHLLLRIFDRLWALVLSEL